MFLCECSAKQNEVHSLSCDPQQHETALNVHVQSRQSSSSCLLPGHSFKAGHQAWIHSPSGHLQGGVSINDSAQDGKIALQVSVDLHNNCKQGAWQGWGSFEYSG